MARLNEVNLLGVIFNIQVVKTENNKFVIGMILTNTKGNKDSLKLNKVTFYSRLDNVIKDCEKLHPGDVVILDGQLSTMDQIKGTRCICGTYNYAKGTKEDSMGTKVYVYPTSLKYMYKHFDLDRNQINEGKIPYDMVEWFKDTNQFGNKVKVAAAVVSTPEIASYNKPLDADSPATKDVYLRFRTKVPRVIHNYNEDMEIAALRKKYEDDMDLNFEDKTRLEDYPYVYIYGKKALDHKLILHTGTVVLVNGYLQSREIKRHLVCENCGCSVTWSEILNEIVPYYDGVEYLRNYNTDVESYEEADRKMIEQIKAGYSKSYN